MAEIDTLDVRILGPVEVAYAFSMRRYAAELTSALDQLEAVSARRALVPDEDARPAPTLTSRDRPFLTRGVSRFRDVLQHRRSTSTARRLRGDVFHVVDQRDAGLLDALPAGRTVQTVHDLLAVTADPDAPRAERIREQLGHAGRLVAISESTRAEILEHTEVPVERVTVIPNGLGEHFRPIPPARLGVVYDALPHSQYRVLHVASNAQPRKNLAGTIRVLHALRQQGLDAILVRVGVPLPEAEQLLADDLGVTLQIADCGYVNDDRLVELYNASDVLLFPSSYEGFGWPPLEAMACGLPVVASNAPALPETLGAPANSDGDHGAALMAPADDIEALTSHVAAVLTNRDLTARLRAAGHARAAEFSWERTARAYLDVYRDLLED